MCAPDARVHRPPSYRSAVVLNILVLCYAQVITISLTGATAVFIGIILYCRWKRLMCY